MKYKIRIDSIGGWYIATLYVKNWFSWSISENSSSKVPYSDKVMEWQEKYKIPDEAITFNPVLK